MNPFGRGTFAGKLQVKELRAEKPEVNITQQAREKDRAYKRRFSRVWFRLGLLAVGMPMQFFAFLVYFLK